MNGNEFYEFEDRAYINPTLSSGEQEKFIDNFRDVQNKNNQQIATDTYNLGKALPSNLGGLGGGESYFNERYQTNQVDDMVANLDTAAKAQALTDVMNNYTNQLKQRYTKAQQAYNRRHRTTTNGNNGNNGNKSNLNITTNGNKGNDTTKVDTSKSEWQAVGDNMWKNTKTGEVVSTKISSGADAMMFDGSVPGLWPDGTRKTQDSVYNSPSGKTYTIKSGLSNNPYDIVEIPGGNNGGRIW